MYAVYVSTTPNPTSGYVFFVDKAEVEILPISVEDGLKLVISMGLVFPDQPIQPKWSKLSAPTRKPDRKASRQAVSGPPGKKQCYPALINLTASSRSNR